MNSNDKSAYRIYWSHRPLVLVPNIMILHGTVPGRAFVGQFVAIGSAKSNKKGVCNGMHEYTLERYYVYACTASTFQ